MNLREFIGVTGPQLVEPAKVLVDLGFKHYRISPEWPVIEEKEGIRKWDWLDNLMRFLQENGCEVLFTPFSIPCWLRPEYPRINFINHCAIPIFVDEWIGKWIHFLTELQARYECVKLYGLVTEVNLPSWWRDPKRQPEANAVGSTKEFVRQVIKPTYEFLHPKGIRVIGPGVTLQGEKESTFQRSTKAWLEVRRAATVWPEEDPTLEDPITYLDNMDIHIYRNAPKEVADDFIRVFLTYVQPILGEESPWYGRKIFVSEGVGFNGSMKHLTPWEQFWLWFTQNIPTAQQAQLDKYTGWIENFVLKTKNLADKFERVYLYRAHEADGRENGDALLMDRLNKYKPKLAAEYLSKKFLENAA